MNLMFRGIDNCRQITVVDFVGEAKALDGQVQAVIGYGAQDRQVECSSNGVSESMEVPGVGEGEMPGVEAASNAPTGPPVPVVAYSVQACV